ncbi:MAG: hypothetical protein LBO00_04725 [Zoogloeaceae bacterium]|jgi:hypothetical protein|nr:hypothetical protein [Zoogloeaceae bacterium]
MLHHFNCPPRDNYREWSRDYSLVFDWDDETGEVTGRDADFVLGCFKDGSVSAHPIPWGWKLTSTKNKTDMAAVIGFDNELPDVLKGHYPRLEDDFDGNIRDMDGNVIGQVDF